MNPCCRPEAAPPQGAERQPIGFFARWTEMVRAATQAASPSADAHRRRVLLRLAGSASPLVDVPLQQRRQSFDDQRMTVLHVGLLGRIGLQVEQLARGRALWRLAWPRLAPAARVG